MRRQPVKSAAIARVGYDEKNRVLEVKFHSGRVYDYFELPSHVVRAFLTSDSLGKSFNDVIRPLYRMARVRETMQAEREERTGTVSPERSGALT